MGIRGLHWFLENGGGGGDVGTKTALQGPVLFDGSSLAYDLYFRSPISWALSDYVVFDQLVREHLHSLASACRPVILIDGVPPEAKHKERIRRFQDKLERCVRVSREIAQSHDGRLGGGPVGHGGAAGGSGVLPPWAMECFLQAAQGCPGVDVYVCDSEADGALGAVAAGMTIPAPVVSNDSDFFVMDLPGGYIPLKSVRVEGPGQVAAVVYHASAVAKHLGMAPAMLPAFGSLCGSDYVDDDITACLMDRLRQRSKGEGSRLPPVELVAKFCAAFASPEAALDSALTLIDRGLHPRARQCWLRSIHQYSLALGNTAAAADVASLLAHAPSDTATALDASVRARVRAGSLHPKVAQVMAHQTFWCDPYLDDFSKPSAWDVSAPLRAVLYAACAPAGADVVEYYPLKGSCARKVVPAPDPSAAAFRLSDVTGLSLAERRRLLCRSIGVPSPPDTSYEAWALPLMALGYLVGRDSTWRAHEAHAIVAMLLCRARHRSPPNDTTAASSTATGSRRAGKTRGSARDPAPSVETPTLRTVRLGTQWQTTLLVCNFLNQCLGCPYPPVQPTLACDGPTLGNLLAAPHPAHSADAACPLLCSACAADVDGVVSRFASMVGYAMGCCAGSKRQRAGTATSSAPIRDQGTTQRQFLGRHAQAGARGKAQTSNPFGLLMDTDD